MNLETPIPFIDIKSIQGIFFDFGYVIGYPVVGIDRKYFYLNWDGIDAILRDPAIKQCFRSNVGKVELVAFFERELYRVFRLHEEADLIDPQSNKILNDKLPQILDCPIDQKLVDRLLFHLDTMKYIAIDPASMKVIAELKHRGYCLALVSNMMLPGKLLRAKLQQANLLAYFDAVTISSDVGYIKPHPEIFRQALDQCHLHADQVVFLGDTYKQDILGAKRVGMKTIWLNSRQESDALALDDPPDATLKNISDLVSSLVSG